MFLIALQEFLKVIPLRKILRFQAKVFHEASNLLLPLLRHLMFGVPHLYPEAIRMVAELAVYGLSAGLFYRYLPKKPFGIYVSLLSAQFFGRLAWGLMAYLVSVFDKKSEFFVEMVMTATISGSLIGIGIQLLLIPPVVYAMQKARFISKY